MSWYNDENWYAPNYEAAEPPKTEAAKEPPKAIRSSKKARIITVCAVAAVLLAAVLLAIFLPGNETAPSEGEGSLLPEDWHEYFSPLTDNEPTMEFTMPAFEGTLALDLTYSAGGSSMSLREIYTRVVPSVVGIRSYYAKSSTTYGWGSGVILSADGYIVTNAHVIDGAETAEVVLYDGTEYDALLVGADETTDLAILKIDAEGLRPAVFAAPDTVQVGDIAVAIGNPLNESLSYTMTTGIISAPRRNVAHNGYSMELIQSDTPINSGNSGGPLLNEGGEVIGITNMKMVTFFSSNVEGIGFAIPTDKVRQLVCELTGIPTAEGPAIGITVAPVGEEIADYYGIPNGLYVAKVSSGSDAEKQGIKVGDIVTAVNGSEVHENDELLQIREETGEGGTLHFEVWRDGKEMSFDVKIMNANELQ